MAATTSNLKKTATRELALFLTLLFVGLVVLPLLIYMVGNALFGDYGGSGFAGFYNTLHGKLRDGEPVVWVLMLSPYLAWQMLRLTVAGFRHFGAPKQQKVP